MFCPQPKPAKTKKTHHCIDCKKQLADYRSKRCNACYGISKQKRVTVICKQCGRSFWLHSCRQKTSIYKFCSMNCSSMFRRNKEKKTCKNCGKHFQIAPSQLKFYKGAGKYCSRECSYSGIVKSNANKPTKDRYGRTQRKDDKTWKELVRIKHNSTCARCGKLEKHIHTHHVKPRSRYPELKHDVTNGICLCNSCHTFVHHHPKEAAENGWLYVAKHIK